ncbi:hypothetical protein ABID82_007137 [Methylobacterium sp. PvP062]|uniref:Uncharacterized protein n=1 Tax=Methylobacterium radiotolerans TaxID=31998 RepID=A0ABV2NTY8_9HYPH|nr:MULTISPECIES: hypothetical protein [unclassified Methylobacterium]MBP2498340.1 hypothetical protein [Methylobacterium sp. PvP105]MBP2505724.1 hypothetical protein [Methylobacterium sp. PvP109]
MRLVTKEIMAAAELVDPAKHAGVVDGASLIVRSGQSYDFAEVERVKGGLAFRVPGHSTLLMLDEDALVGIEVRLADGAEDAHKIRSLTDLLAWAAKERKA